MYWLTNHLFDPTYHMLDSFFRAANDSSAFSRNNRSISTGSPPPPPPPAPNTRPLLGTCASTSIRCSLSSSRRRSRCDESWSRWWWRLLDDDFLWPSSCRWWLLSLLEDEDFFDDECRSDDRRLLSISSVLVSYLFSIIMLIKEKRNKSVKFRIKIYLSATRAARFMFADSVVSIKKKFRAKIELLRFLKRNQLFCDSKYLLGMFVIFWWWFGFLFFFF